jgi:hypothetical protein
MRYLNKLNTFKMLLFNFTILVSLNAYTECSTSVSIDYLASFAELEQLERDLEEYREDLYIEKNHFFRYLLHTLSNSHEVKNLSSKDTVLIKPYNLRGDLMAVDIIDQVTEILGARGFEGYKKKLELILDGDPVENFVKWYLMVKELAGNDLRLKKKLNKNLVFQVYDKTGTALATVPKRLSKNYDSHVKRNRLVSLYNIYGADPESSELLISFIPMEIEPYITERFTVQKMKDVKKSELKEKRISFYEDFCEEYLKMEDAVTADYEIKCNPNEKNPVSLKVSRDASKRVKQTLKPLFELINNSSNKRDYTAMMLPFGQDLNDLKYPNPQLMLDNLEEYDEAIKEYTYQGLLSAEDDETDFPYFIKEFIPGHEFFGDSERLSFKFAVRNDALATRVNIIRHGVKFYNDHGETHGVELEAAKKLSNSNTNLTLMYHSNLFTEAHYLEIDENNYTNQTFTSEQVLKALINNITPEGTWYFDSGAGVIELNSTDDQNIFRASTQQRIYHGNTNNYNIYNKATPTQNQLGVTANLYGGMKKSLINENIGLRLDLKGDFGFDVATIENYNNFKVRFASDLYFQRPNGSLGAKLSLGVPLTFHRTDDDQESIFPSLEVRPKVGLSLASRKTEFGMALEIPFGPLRTYIQENSRTIDEGIILDFGEIGTIYLKRKF